MKSRISLVVLMAILLDLGFFISNDELNPLWRNETPDEPFIIALFKRILTL